MARSIKIFSIVITLVGTLFLFQNCVVNQDADGNLTIEESFPQQFDKLIVSRGLSDKESETEVKMEIDLNSGEIVYEAGFPGQEQKCLHNDELSAAEKEEVIEKFKAAKICRQIIESDPDQVCSTKMLSMDFIKAYNLGQEVANEAIGSTSSCPQGTLNTMCGDGDIFMDLVESMSSVMQESCQ